MHLKHRQTCRVCGNPHLVDVIDLGDQYLQGSFVKDGMTPPTTRKIPTKLVRCDTSKNEDGCGLVQMSVTTPPKILYSNYWYKSAVSQTMRDHLKEIVRQAMNLVANPTDVLDIAANDGTLLSYYPENTCKVAVDPSDIARSIKLPNCAVINDLFPTSKLTASLQFAIITSIAMFYDLEDPVEFVRAIRRHLALAGIWIVEVAYLPATLRQVSYDTIVGEHLEYYSLSSLEAVMSAAGMRVFGAELNDINGGSIKCFCCRDDCFAYDNPEWLPALNQIRIDEFTMELDTDNPYQIFRSKVVIQKYELQKLIAQFKAEGRTIALYGASTKANTLLQYCGLDSTVIDHAAERSPEKWGAKTLGTNIPIISEEESRARMKSGDVYVVGPWHFKSEILKREVDTIGRGVRFVFPLPKLEVVGG